MRRAGWRLRWSTWAWSTVCRIGVDSLVIDTTDVDRFGRNIALVARECGVRLREVEPTDDDLESVFRYLVERR